MSRDTVHSSASLPTPNPSKSFWHTEPDPLLIGHRSTRYLPAHADVVVIGSGITGASVAWHLLKDSAAKDGGSGDGREREGEKGLEVLMLEAREACWGATGRNGGHCQPLVYAHASDPSIGSFELSNHAALSSLIKSLNIDCEFHSQPGIRVLNSSSDLSAARASIATLAKSSPELSSQVRLVTDKAELTTLRIPFAHGAVVSKTAARLWPYKFVAAILHTLLTSLPETLNGGKLNLQTSTPVTSLSPDNNSSGGWLLQTPRGEVRAKRVVLATNAYTSHLLPQFADLIVPCRGQMSALSPPAGLSGEKRLQANYGFVSASQDDYLIQRPASTTSSDRGKGEGRGEELMFGGGRDHGPSLGLCDDGVVDSNVAAYLRSALHNLLDGSEEGKGELQATHEWTGIMAFSRDDKPFVGPVPRQKGVWLAGGYTGHGMPNAWLCGKAVADMVVGMQRIEEKGEEWESREKEVLDRCVRDGLPRAYVLDEARMERARELPTVAEQDESYAFKAETM